jgi:hypothetical protein
MAKPKNGRPENLSLDAILAGMQIEQWDLVLIGDGSGSGWNAACGWCSMLIDRKTRGRRIFHGGMNLGSVNVAESMPYIQAMAWYDAYQRDKHQQLGSTHVHIITDSQTVAQWLNAASDVTRPIPGGSGTVLGSYIREMCRKGYIFHNHWARRMSNQVNWAADLIAGLSRTAFVNTISENNTELTTAQLSAEFLAKVELIDPASKQLLNIYEIGA